MRVDALVVCRRWIGALPADRQAPVNETGYLADPGELAVLIRMAEKCVRPEAGHRLGKAARLHLSTHFSRDTAVTRLLAIDDSTNTFSWSAR
jgi:hypothetical protein